MSDYLKQLKKDNDNKLAELENKKMEVKEEQKSKELDMKLNSFNKPKNSFDFKNFNMDKIKDKVKFWAIAIVVGIVGSLIFYKILMKFIG